MDDGYCGEASWNFKVPIDVLTQTEEMTINAWFKSFEVLEQLYCHNPTQHGYVFQAVAVLVQLSIKMGIHFTM